MSQPSSTFSPNLRCPSVGSTTTSILSRDEAKRLFERTHQRWSQTNDQLNSAIRERTTSPLGTFDPRQKDNEITTLRQDLANIQAQLDQYRQQLQFAEATILQQQATIRNQSKAIENPRPGRDGPTTPRHQHSYGTFPTAQSHHAPQTGYSYQGSQTQYGQAQQLRSLYGPVPPANTSSTVNAINTASTGPFGSSSAAHTPQSATKPGLLRINDYGSPEHYNPVPPSAVPPYADSKPNHTYPQTWQSAANDPFAAVGTFSTTNSPTANGFQFQSLQHFASPESIASNPYPETSIPNGLSSFNVSLNSNSASNIRESFQKVFDMAQQYAKTHANYPSTVGEYALPQAIKDRLLSAATNTTAFGLMSDRGTRYLLVAKVMIQWITKHVLKYNTFSGLDTNMDQIINGARAAIYQSTPAQLRFLLLTNVANEIRKLREKPDFNAYVKHLSQQRANQLMQLVRPMMHQQTVGEWQDLVALLHECYRLAELMFTGTDEFSFDFPACHHKFDANEMINIDTQLGNYNLVDLKAMQASVRLGTTPIVRIRRNMPQGEAPSQVIVKAKVLLKK